MYENDCRKETKSNIDNKQSGANKTQQGIGYISLKNPHLTSLNPDILYHVGLDTSQDLERKFGDIRFVCMGGTPKRMEEFANYIMKEINYVIPVGTQLLDISLHSNRYSMFKVGPVLSVSHGMGIPSISILLHEMIKLMYYAKCKNPIFFRLGTCGGIGLPPGSVVISEKAVDGMLNDYYELPILGMLSKKPSTFDEQLVKDLKTLAATNRSYTTATGTTLCALDFYEGQARLDGAFCDYTQEDRVQFFNRLQNNGIINIEMESLPFGALTKQAGIKSAVVCVTLLDRLKGDQISVPQEMFAEWEDRPQKLVARYIKQTLNIKN